MLLAQAQRQFHEDGVGAEQSPTYATFSLEWLLLAAVAGARAGEPFPPAFWQRLEQVGGFLRSLIDIRGGFPRIGDDDEGTLFHGQGTPQERVASVLAALAAGCQNREVGPASIRPQLRQAMFGMLAGAAAPAGVRHFPRGGYTVARESTAAGEALLVFDHGPLGYLSLAAHGHADALSLWLHVDGRPVLIDAGTFLYHASDGWRDHFRGTAAHNTLSIDGRDSSEVAGPFNWSGKAQCRVVGFENGSDA